MTQSVLEAWASFNGLAQVNFDVVSAFLHASEENKKIFLDPPAEWKQEKPGREQLIWRLRRSLYGRQTADRDFRECLEAVLMSTPGAEMQQSSADMCLYYSPVWGLALLHHVDDGVIVGPQERIWELVAWISKYILIKVSEEVTPGKAVKFLKRTKVRTEKGSITLPDPKLDDRVVDAMGYSESMKPAVTPGVKRVDSKNDEDRAARSDRDFRSIGGSLVYLSSDVPTLTFAAKEVARKLHAPTLTDWHGVARCVRYLIGKRSWGVENEVTHSGGKVEISVWVDAGFAEMRMPDRQLATALRWLAMRCAESHRLSQGYQRSAQEKQSCEHSAGQCAQRCT